VSLHGTLETFALPDVLALLAATKKNGELHVVGGKTDGRVWFDAGNVVGADVGRSVTFVDAVFELLRLASGKFSFDADSPAPVPGEPQAIQPLLDEAQTRLTEWREIESVIPSLEHGVRLVPEVREGPVTVSGAQWRALVGVATMPTVQGVAERLGLGEFEACRTLKGLVDAGLMTVEERVVPSAPAPAPAEPVAAPAPAPAVEAAPPAPDTEAPAKPKIAALTSTSAASVVALEAEEPTPAVPAEPVDSTEATELVRQVAALETEAPAPVVEAPAPAEPEADASVEAAPAAAVPGEEQPAPGDEPINRGLLLKFLSSVRT
jgi:hypothetical protein